MCNNHLNSFDLIIPILFPKAVYLNVQTESIKTPRRFNLVIFPQGNDAIVLLTVLFTCWSLAVTQEANISLEEKQAVSALKLNNQIINRSIIYFNVLIKEMTLIIRCWAGVQ